MGNAFFRATALAAAMVFGVGLARAETRTTSNGEEIGILIMGTIVNTNNKDNVALIKEIVAGHVKAVKNGFKVLEGKFTVADVQTKYILLKTSQGDLHLVYQDKFAGDFLTRKKTTNATYKSAANSDAFNEDGFERKEGKVRMTAAFRDKIVDQDLSKILMQATAVPNYEDGVLKGFRLLQIDKGSIFDNSGFLDDDIITAINGVPLASVPGAIKLLHSLKKETGIQIEYLRKGQYNSLAVSIN